MCRLEAGIADVGGVGTVAAGNAKELAHTRLSPPISVCFIKCYYIQSAAASSCRHTCSSTQHHISSGSALSYSVLHNVVPRGLVHPTYLAYSAPLRRESAFSI